MNEDGLEGLTHFGSEGQARMVEVGDKSETQRTATAEGVIEMAPETLARIRGGQMGKGDVLGVARIAAIQAAKRTHELIPLCHLLGLTGVDVSFADRDQPALIRCQVTARTRGRTGVEMEALTAVTVALLTIYDMCKAIDRGMVMRETRLIEKQGGRSGLWRAEEGSAV